MSNQTLQQLKEAWENSTLAKVISRFPERKSRFTTSSDIELDRVYIPDEPCDVDTYREQLGFPGEYPFTRGVHHVSRPLVHHAPVRRIRHSRRAERALSPSLTPGRPV